MVAFPTDAWFQALVERIGSSAAYRDAAAGWEGDIAFLIEAEPDRGLPEEVWGLLDLWHGECRSGGVVAPERGRAAAYVIRAPYSRWKEVVTGELDPIKGMMQGKLKVQGDLPTIVREVRSASELVELTQQIPTEFPDEV
ncbi:MAG: SCP2 sterol-binding domain-containing protein [Actinomycetota bacterium]|nr:SCP2 sterol-binding domain-containing protein [Actinomycetota bacterium]